nr:hypothetical protein CFP56_13308 [Quercus suber]
MPAGGRAGFITLLRNLLLASTLYVALYFTVELASSPAARDKARSHLPGKLANMFANGTVEPTDGGEKFKVTVPDTGRTVTINPHANIFNRPSSAVAVNDAYLGKRPHVDTEADLHMLVEQCRGSYAGLEKMRDVFSCLQFLADGESRYYHLPDHKDRASGQRPKDAEYADADGHGNTLSQYSPYEPASADTIGRCSGPIVPYHVYWSGPATWRVEVFIKSYLHTQNLPCSRLWLWLDADRDPNAVDKFLRSDPVFARFLPLVERGDVRVMAWNFPTKMPLPPGMDHTDGIGYYSTPGSYNVQGDRPIADGLIEDLDGNQFIQLKETQMTFFAQAISDAVRFVILHLHGGLYLDMDVLLLRDMRPLLLPKTHNFAERWAAHSHPGDFNTAILSLSANTSLSSYLLRGGVRMGLNFHPRVIGRMAWKDGRDQELLMFETAAFDPIWTEFNRDREGRCTVPCVKDYGQVFKGKKDSIKDEWESFEGQPLQRLDVLPASAKEIKSTGAAAEEAVSNQLPATQAPVRASLRERSIQAIPGSDSTVSVLEAGDPLHSISVTDTDVDLLRHAGVILDYREDQDKYPPTNRTLEHFFRGAWTYHIHNQWAKHPEPSSWLAVLQSAHDRFFHGGVNAYGEHWDGPQLLSYNEWPESLYNLQENVSEYSLDQHLRQDTKTAEMLENLSGLLTFRPRLRERKSGLSSN